MSNFVLLASQKKLKDSFAANFVFVSSEKDAVRNLRWDVIADFVLCRIHFW